MDETKRDSITKTGQLITSPSIIAKHRRVSRQFCDYVVSSLEKYNLRIYCLKEEHNRIRKCKCTFETLEIKL